METCDLLDVGCWLEWSFDELKQFFLSIYGWFLDGLLALINLIPVPDFLENSGTYTIPSNFSYYLDLLEFETGISLVISAYIARFVLRRIPFIG